MALTPGLLLGDDDEVALFQGELAPLEEGLDVLLEKLRAHRDPARKPSSTGVSPTHHARAHQERLWGREDSLEFGPAVTDLEVECREDGLWLARLVGCRDKEGIERGLRVGGSVLQAKHSRGGRVKA